VLWRLRCETLVRLWGLQGRQESFHQFARGSFGTFLYQRCCCKKMALALALDRCLARFCYFFRIHNQEGFNNGARERERERDKVREIIQIYCDTHGVVTGSDTTGMPTLVSVWNLPMYWLRGAFGAPFFTSFGIARSQLNTRHPLTSNARARAGCIRARTTPQPP